jgi:hypothetical protein
MGAAMIVAGAIGVAYCRENHFLCSVALKNGMAIIEDLL